MGNCCGLMRNSSFCSDCGKQLYDEIEEPGFSLLAHIRRGLRTHDVAAKGSQERRRRNIGGWTEAELAKEDAKYQLRRELYLAWIVYLEQVLKTSRTRSDDA